MPEIFAGLIYEVIKGFVITTLSMLCYILLLLKAGYLVVTTGWFRKSGDNRII
ncbi:MAG: hypothetical protein AB1757_10060 [Acidobacteriota bacterium]